MYEKSGDITKKLQKAQKFCDNWWHILCSDTREGKSYLQHMLRDVWVMLALCFCARATLAPISMAYTRKYP